MGDAVTRSGARNSVSVSELAVVVEGLRHIMDERDQRYEERIQALRESVNAALHAADRAIQKAESAAEKRFESVNEFRATLSDQQRTFIPRSEAEIMFRTLEAKAGVNTRALEQLAAERAGIKGGWGYAAGAAGLVLTLFSLLMVLWRFGSL
jgi:flagellar biosynthesis chaperone FliJ